VPAETSFAAVTDEVGRRLSGDRATAMTRVLGRRRLLLSAVAEGAGLAGELALPLAEGALVAPLGDEVVVLVPVPGATVPRDTAPGDAETILGDAVQDDTASAAHLFAARILACSCSWNACAVKMYVHVNTVRYRIRRIEELTGRDLSCLDDQVNFFLALRIR
jgi:PucR C-terminal helix-turn-helix domain